MLRQFDSITFPIGVLAVGTPKTLAHTMTDGPEGKSEFVVEEILSSEDCLLDITASSKPLSGQNTGAFIPGISNGIRYIVPGEFVIQGSATIGGTVTPSVAFVAGSYLALNGYWR